MNDEISQALKAIQPSALETIQAHLNTLPQPTIQLPRMPVFESPAEQAFQTLVNQIRLFEASTSDGEVVGAMLASFGQSVTIHIHQLRQSGQFICMDGLTASGDKATLVQHFTQASILLIKVPLLPTEEKRPIGFM